MRPLGLALAALVVGVLWFGQIPTSSPQARIEGRYTLDASVHLAVGRVPRAEDLALHVRGTWNLNSTRADEVVAQLEDLQVQSYEPLDVHELQQPFVIHLAPNGTVESLGFPEAVGPRERQVVSGLATALAGKLEPGRLFAEDTTGRYEALVEQDRGRLTRTKLGYLGLHHSQAETDVEATASFTWKGPVLQALIEEQRLVVHSEIPLHSRSRLLLTRSGPHRELSAPPTRVHHVAAPLANTAPIAIGSPLSFDELLAELGATRRLPEREAQRALARSIPLAEALFRGIPGAAWKAFDRLAAGASEEEELVLLAALAGTGTSEARDALTALTGPEHPDAIRMRATMNLALLVNPDATTFDTLSTQMQSTNPTLAGTAALALGGTVRTVGNAVSDEVLQPLIDLWGQAESTRDRRLALESLANTGHPGASTVLMGALDDPELRSLALFALRFQPGHEVDSLLADALVAASSDERFAALRATSHRNRDDWVHRYPALMQDSDDRVRAFAESLLTD